MKAEEGLLVEFRNSGFLSGCYQRLQSRWNAWGRDWLWIAGLTCWRLKSNVRSWKRCTYKDSHCSNLQAYVAFAYTYYTE